MEREKLKYFLENLYLCYNKRCYVNPDPLQFLYGYDDIRDREIVGLISSSLAYGRVNLIIKNVKFILDLINEPYKFIINKDINLLMPHLADFKHRFNNGMDILNILFGIKKLLLKFGSLENCLSFYYKRDKNLLSALSLFVKELRSYNNEKSFLLTDPLMGSACKRLLLFLRWMVRKDDVDCGGWNFIPPKELIVPLDTHLFRISRELGLTKRKQADMKTALEITENFSQICPEDPVKYDFVLTRFGIRKEEEFCKDINLVCENITFSSNKNSN